jgi:hypothetical protein
MSAMARPWLGVVIGAALACAVWTAAGALKPIKPVLAQGQTGIVSVAAGAAHYIHYQGQLFNPNSNTPLGNFAFGATFRLYGALNGDGSGANQLWTESKPITTNVDGLFNTNLGDAAPLNAAIFDGRELYLAVDINGEELRPLQRITYVPYAFWSRNADFLDGFSSGDFAKIVAYGFVDDDGDRESGRNFDSDRRTVGNDEVYIIDIGGVDYEYRRYTTLVTPACAAPVFVGVGSSDGNLIVDTWDRNGNRTECRFQFVTLRRED